MTEYPEHEKLSKVSQKSQACGEFLDWLYQQGYHLCSISDGYEDTYVPTPKPVRRLLAEYFEIDEEKIETEKRAMMAELRKLNEPPAAPL